MIQQYANSGTAYGIPAVSIRAVLICRVRAFTAITLITCISLPTCAHAYIGPGAGFAFLGSGAVFLLAILMAVSTIILWPIHYLYRAALGKGRPKNARVKRVVIIGLDGLDPKLTEQLMEKGELPHLSSLRETGTYARLGTTLPALSPVAWSTFQTGVNPGAHNIFDFLTRDKRFCLPELSAVKTETVTTHWRCGPFKVPRIKAQVKLMRRSQPFWKLLGERNILANIIRVPISYPPEKFRGNILSAMCTPDLRGTQGTFSLFTTRSSVEVEEGADSTGGEVKRVNLENGVVRTSLQGPPSQKTQEGYASVPLTLQILSDEAVGLTIGAKTVTLSLNIFSEWVPVQFEVGKNTVQGIVRFCVREITPHLTLYASPVNIDPSKPALPISYPLVFSSWLARRQGPYGTLGLLEDTWGRNELALDDKRFLDQAYLAHTEREKMFFETLKQTREGVCICVFDASDRIQHMFWRYLDPKHPSPCENRAEFGDTIPTMYRKMDTLIGKTVEQLGDEDILMVISDHGFSSFRRCIALNTWLYKEGYLVIKGDAPTGADYLQDVDWGKTRAFALGLSGLYINLAGRERNGIVQESEADSLKAEIIKKLECLKDPQDNSPAVKRVYDTRKVYRGLYTEEAPDLIVGYNPGYRVSWDSITGTIEPEVFSDNTKAWSGDHHVDPSEVPGIFFVNRKAKSESLHISDIAPTTLDLFGITPPSYMEGKVVL